MNGCARWLRYITLVMTVVLFALLVTIACIGLAESALQIERISVFLSIIDDFLIRVLASVVLVVAGVGLVIEEYDRLCPSSSTSAPPAEGDKKGALLDRIGSRNAALLQFAAVAALSGVGFVVAEGIDKDNDSGNLKFLKDSHAFLLGASAHSNVPILARWVQVVPQESFGKDGNCVIRPDRKAEDLAGVMGPQTCPIDFLVRTVIPATAKNCPTVDIAYDDSNTVFSRQRARHRLAGNGFKDITVCEARIGGSGDPRNRKARPRKVTFADGVSIPLTERWTENDGPKTVSIFGDTGCRANSDQRCDEESWRYLNDDQKWRFGDVVSAQVGAGGGAKADLIVHVGDYMYYKFDNWEAWKASFFDPSASLLTAAPWVMVRGNHERCGKFGDTPLGYYLFFYPGDGLQCDRETEVTETFALDISVNRRIIVVDNTIAHTQNVREPGQGKEAHILDAMSQTLKHAAHLAQTDKTVWLVQHVPVFALEPCEVQEKKDNEEGGKIFSFANAENEKCEFTDNITDEQAYADMPESSAMMRKAWTDAGMFETNIKTIISGDRHYFQIVKPITNNVREEAIGEDIVQFTSGAGGVNLDPPGALEANACISLDQTATLGKAINSPDGFADMWETCTQAQFGYLLADQDNGKDRFTYIPLGGGR